MKILFFVASLRSGGAERQVVELLKGFNNHDGVSCELVTMSEEIHYKYIERLNVPVHYLIRRSNKDFGIFARFNKLCKQINPDIVHSWNSMCSIYAIPGVVINKIKFINGFLRNAPPEFNYRHPAWLRAKLSFPFSDAILSNSNAGLRSYHVQGLKKSVCIRNGFDFSRTKSLINGDDVREKLFINTPLVVGMVASFSENKDYVTFIEAAKIIVAQRDDVTFVAVGGGEQLDYCKGLVPEALQAKIMLLGRQEDVENIIQLFTIGMLLSDPSHGEGISNTVMEYMALEKPVIASDCGGNNELITEGVTGLIVPLENIIATCTAINSLLNDAELCAKMGAAGNQRLLKDFNLQKMVGAYGSLYQSLAEDRL